MQLRFPEIDEFRGLMGFLQAWFPSLSFSHYLTQTEDTHTSFWSINLGCKMILLNGVHPTVAMGSHWKPSTSLYTVMRISVKGLHIVVRLKSWTEHGSHCVLAVRMFTQCYPANRTACMLLQPFVYTGHMEGVPTVGEDAQHIFTKEFCKANWAPATCNITLVGYISRKCEKK